MSVNGQTPARRPDVAAAPGAGLDLNPHDREVVRVIAERYRVFGTITGHISEDGTVPTFAGVYCSRRHAASGLVDSVDAVARRRTQVREQLAERGGPS